MFIPRVRDEANVRSKLRTKIEDVSESDDEYFKDSWFVPGDQADSKFRPRYKEESSAVLKPRAQKDVDNSDRVKQDPRFEEEVIIGSWFWAEKEAGMEAGASAICESTPGAEEGAIGGSSFWTEEKFSLGAMAREETRPESEEEAIFGSWFWDRDEACFDLNPNPVYKASPRFRDSAEEIKHHPGPKLGKRSLLSSNLVLVISLVSHPQAPLEFLKKQQQLHSLNCLRESPRMQNVPQKGKSRNLCFSWISLILSSHFSMNHPTGQSGKFGSILGPGRLQSLRVGPAAASNVNLKFKIIIFKIIIGLRSASQFTRDFIQDSGVVSLIETLLNYPPSQGRTQFLENTILMAYHIQI